MNKRIRKKREKVIRAMEAQQKDIEQPQEECVQETENIETAEPTQEEWAAALENTVKERDGYKDSWMRTQAEFQNFKRRNATARADGYEDGVRETVNVTLPAIDNLELALKAAETHGETGALYDGVKLTLKLLTDALGKVGLEEVAALGETFDPELHEAVMREPGGTENQIVEVFRKGYKVKDRMIRYAMVKVSSGEQ